MALLYPSYFVHFVTDIPIDLSQLQCKGHLIYLFCINLKHLLELLVLVSAGNASTDKCRHLKREARKRRDFLKDHSDEMKLHLEPAQHQFRNREQTDLCIFLLLSRSGLGFHANRISEQVRRRRSKMQIGTLLSGKKPENNITMNLQHEVPINDQSFED